MNTIFYCIAFLLPFLGGMGAAFLPFRQRKNFERYCEAVCLATSLLVGLLIWKRPTGELTLFTFTTHLTFSFRLDSVGCVFAVILAVLWPLTLLYAFPYLAYEEKEKRHRFPKLPGARETGLPAPFFCFFLMTYGATLGIAMASNMLTMYCCYEAMTLVSLPLVMYPMTREARRATRTYMVYSLGGAAFAFIGMLFAALYGVSLNFVPGGVFPAGLSGTVLLMYRLVYVGAFMGFSVKAAMVPFSRWLPLAGVAPTPVTALLHAVAVVKSGAFACLRLTYFCYDTEQLRGSFAQTIPMFLAIITIIYGCSRALKETHIKRRLAWSTVGNLSYILFGITIMTPLGLRGALAHMLSHAVMKIAAFCCAGVLIVEADTHYVYELDGYGHRMPRTMLLLMLSGLGLMGVPGTCGFVSKWYLAQAAICSEEPLSYIGTAAMLVSALLTAVYMMTMCVRAFVPGHNVDWDRVFKLHDPGWEMLLPLVVFIFLMFLMGLNGGVLGDALNRVVTEVIMASGG